MPIQTIQGAFNSGELSPHMLGRVDLEDYRSGAKTILNWLVRPEGSVMRRSGTRYVHDVEDHAVKSRLVPFVFSVTQAYILEFCDLKIRVYRNEDLVLESTQAITNITRSNPAVVTIVGHGYENGDEVYIASVGGMTEVNDLYFTVANKTADTFQLSGIDSTAYTAYTSGGTVARVYEVTTTYTEAQLPDLHFAQSADILYIAHQSHPPATLTRTGDASWTLADYEFIDGPYLGYRVIEVGADQQPNTTTISCSAITGSMTVTASAAMFDATRDIGRVMRQASIWGTWGAMRITAVADTTHCTATVTAGYDANDPEISPGPLPMAAGVPSKWWYMGAYYIGNYPATVSFFEGRLAFAGTVEEPERLDGSVTGGWDDFSPTYRGSATGQVLADSAISYQLGGANDIQIIRWISPTRNLLMGTTGGVWPVQTGVYDSSTDEPLTATNVNVSRSSAKGSASIQPQNIAEAVIYVSRTQKKLFVAGYNWEGDAYRADDLTLLADHITGVGVDALAYQHEPFSILWALRSDGVLAAMTYEPAQKVFGWHRHKIGGSFGTGDAVVESIAVIPSPNADHDQLWMTVKRTINGSTVRYVEFLEQEFADSDDIEDAFFVDSGYTYDSTPVSSISSNIDHLEGETVRILGDGAVQPDQVVTSGTVTISPAASVVHIGLAYNSDLETLPINLAPTALERGTPAGRLMRPTHALIRFHRAVGLEIGPDSDNLSDIPFRSTSDPMDAPPPLFTGIKRWALKQGHDREATVFFRKSDPLPASILSVVGSLKVGQR